MRQVVRSEVLFERGATQILELLRCIDVHQYSGIVNDHFQNAFRPGIDDKIRSPLGRKPEYFIQRNPAKESRVTATSIPNGQDNRLC